MISPEVDQPCFKHPGAWVLAFKGVDIGVGEKKTLLDWGFRHGGRFEIEIDQRLWRAHI